MVDPVARDQEERKNEGESKRGKRCEGVLEEGLGEKLEGNRNGGRGGRGV